MQHAIATKLSIGDIPTYMHNILCMCMCTTDNLIQIPVAKNYHNTFGFSFCTPTNFSYDRYDRITVVYYSERIVLCRSVVRKRVNIELANQKQEAMSFLESDWPIRY